MMLEWYSRLVATHHPPLPTARAKRVAAVSMPPPWGPPTRQVNSSIFPLWAYPTPKGAAWLGLFLPVRLVKPPPPEAFGGVVPEDQSPHPGVPDPLGGVEGVVAAHLEGPEEAPPEGVGGRGGAKSPARTRSKVR